MLQVNVNSMMTEAVLNEDNVKLDQACDTETNDDPFSDGETRGSLQSVSKSSIGYQSGGFTDTSETVEPDEPTFACEAAACSHDPKQADLTKLGSTDHMDSKWGDCGSLTCSCYQLALLHKRTNHMIVTNYNYGIVVA